MKHCFANLFLLLSLTSLLLTSCADDYSGTLVATTDPHFLQADKSQLSFGAVPSTQSFGVKSMGLTWNAKSSTDWINVGPSTGSASGNVAVSVQENRTYSTTGRAGTITLSDESGRLKDRFITVGQESPSLRLSVSTNSVYLPGSASSATVDVVSNMDWTFSVADASWLIATKGKDGNVLMIDTKENLTGAERTSAISVVAGTKNELITVRQQAAGVELTDGKLDFGWQSDSQQFSFTSGSDWKITTNYAWIEVTPSSGRAGDATVTVKVAVNASETPRSGSFSINNESVAVTQGAVVLKSSPEHLTFGEEGGTLSMDIISNTDWQTKPGVQEDLGWLTFTRDRGVGNATIRFTASKNEGDARSLYLTLHDGWVVSRSIVISQEAASLQVINSLAPFTYEGGSIDFSHLQASDWTAQVAPDASWLHLSPTSGNGSVPVRITVDKNDSLQERSSYFMLQYANGRCYQVLVTQAGRCISASVSQYAFFAKGGTSDAIIVKCDGDFEASSDASWVYGKTSGDVLVLVASENTTSSKRTATVTLRMTGEGQEVQTAVITVTQAGVDAAFEGEGYGDEEYWH